jgi:hypothetical protein
VNRAGLLAQRARNNVHAQLKIFASLLRVFAFAIEGTADAAKDSESGKYRG